MDICKVMKLMDNKCRSMNSRKVSMWSSSHPRTGMREDPKTKYLRDALITYHSSTITSKQYRFYSFRVYIHGGRDLGNGALSSLWSANLVGLNKIQKGQAALDADGMNWEVVKTTGSKTPGAISHHTGLVHGDKLYVFGGTKDSGDSNEHMFTLDLIRFKWEIVEQLGTAPKTRDEHTANLYDGSMVIFGGFEDGARVNSMYRFHISTRKWEKL